MLLYGIGRPVLKEGRGVQWRQPPEADGLNLRVILSPAFWGWNVPRNSHPGACSQRTGGWPETSLHPQMILCKQPRMFSLGTDRVPCLLAFCQEDPCSQGRWEVTQSSVFLLAQPESDVWAVPPPHLGPCSWASWCGPTILADLHSPADKC